MRILIVYCRNKYRIQYADLGMLHFPTRQRQYIRYFLSNSGHLTRWLFPRVIALSCHTFYKWSFFLPVFLYRPAIFKDILLTNYDLKKQKHKHKHCTLYNSICLGFTYMNKESLISWQTGLHNLRGGGRGGGGNFNNFWHTVGWKLLILSIFIQNSPFPPIQMSFCSRSLEAVDWYFFVKFFKIRSIWWIL